MVEEINPPKEGIYANNKINTFAIKHDDKMSQQPHTLKRGGLFRNK